MTIKIELECDGRDCSRVVEIDDYCDQDIWAAGFEGDPVTGGQHYCGKCWPKVKKELEE